MKHEVIEYDPAWVNQDQEQPPVAEAHRKQLQVDSNRQAYLEYLYERDGRHDPSHPFHSLWTGLAVMRRRELALAVIEWIYGDGLMKQEVEQFHADPQHARFFEGRIGAPAAGAAPATGGVPGGAPDGGHAGAAAAG